jgi:hypothetical protein
MIEGSKKKVLYMLLFMPAIVDWKEAYPVVMIIRFFMRQGFHQG